MPVNEFGQPIGDPVPAWTPRPRPPREPVSGRYGRLEPLDADRHAAGLYSALRQGDSRGLWTYLGIGPFPDEAGYRAWAAEAQGSRDPQHFAVVDPATGAALGTLALMRQDPANGVIEIGWVMFSPRMQRTPISTEAHFLLLSLVFDGLGYRRCEWKCDSLNAPSRQAAERLGFRYEGRFRDSVVYKGRSRDTDWLALLRTEWPGRRERLKRWLDPANFDASGRQHRRLAECG